MIVVYKKNASCLLTLATHYQCPILRHDSIIWSNNFPHIMAVGNVIEGVRR